MPVKPARIVQARVVGVTWAVHPRFAICAIIAIERFEHGAAPGPIHDFGRGFGKGICDGLVLIAHHASIAKKPPCQRDGRGIRQRGQKRGKRSVACVDVHKLIDIKRQDPISGCNQLVFGGAFQAGELNAAFVIGAGVWHMHQMAKRGEPVKHRIRAVVAIVRQYKKVGKTNGPMVRQPFQQEGRLVP